MAIIKYTELSEFQKWLFFYLVVHNMIPKNMQGVISDMCSGLKMKINLDDFGGEINKFKKDAEILYNHGLLENASRQSINDSYGLSDIGSIYLLQKIIGPVITAKDKQMEQKIIQYFGQKEPKLENEIRFLLASVSKKNFATSFKNTAAHAIEDFMPFANALDKLHGLAKDFGLDQAPAG
ncbi:MAG: hypothetical protein DWQ18_04685 [Crenarchaeota archaeon]|nr:MAG: hypothetical protein DWQ17_08445 [Thermoproteota archaeon]RDJ34196.1 MAG: hypothetical protein DWQ18_04685 [Thermoproteota archaeon]RDJ36689.1 MAG: hypothetical protein DWQ13_05925 [Thermoproteota archaeon]RDJ37778.1 MAG: hypothetical protein DWQ19_04910 [Thermoproteota archaeon]